MQDSRYPMKSTKQVRVLAVGYCRVLIDLFWDARSNFNVFVRMFASVLLNFGVGGVTFLSILGFLEPFGAPLAAKAGLGTTLGALWEGIGEDLGASGDTFGDFV